MSEETKVHKRSVWRLIGGIVMLFGGIAAMSAPILFTAFLIETISIMVFISGISNLIAYFQIRKIIPNAGPMLFTAVLDIILGLLLLCNGVISAGLSIAWIIGIWLFAAGIMRAVASFTNKKLGVTNWWIELVNGILSVILGAYLFMSPGATLVTIGMVIGAYMVVYGFIMIYRFIANKQIHFS